MIFQFNEILAGIHEFILPFTRVAALFSVAPILSSPFLQLRIKVAIASIITIFMIPLLKETQAVVLFSSNGIIQVGLQILIGLLMGFILRLVFSALTIAGENIAVTMGLGFAQITDPVNGVTVPIVSQFLSITATLLFLAFDGHLALINMLFDSFTYLPIGHTFDYQGALWGVVAWGTNMFSGALMVAIPAITALLVANSALALMTRAAPQLNVFSVGFPITIILGLVVIAITLPSVAVVFQNLLNTAFEQMPFSQ
ncbi:MAG: flagellar biosynthetic protein FliR [Gammaproteobacteria bacterium]|nr:MAG: flagellar biosynthetic protein FliR [Gammaproteobacteria bacterium]